MEGIIFQASNANGPPSKLPFGCRFLLNLSLFKPWRQFQAFSLRPRFQSSHDTARNKESFNVALYTAAGTSHEQILYFFVLLLPNVCSYLLSLIRNRSSSFSAENQNASVRNLFTAFATKSAFLIHKNDHRWKLQFLEFPPAFVCVSSDVGIPLERFYCLFFIEIVHSSH